MELEKTGRSEFLKAPSIGRVRRGGMEMGTEWRARLFLRRRRAIAARKDDRALSKVLGNALVHDRIPHCGGYWGGLFPICSFGIGFPSESGGGAEGMDSEPGMVWKEGNENAG